MAGVEQRYTHCDYSFQPIEYFAVHTAIEELPGLAGGEGLLFAKAAGGGSRLCGFEGEIPSGLENSGYP